MINLKPQKLNECLIHPITINLLLNTDFVNNNVLLRGRAGVGKTTITKLLSKTYPNLLVFENITNNFNINYKPIIGTTNNLNFEHKLFNLCIDVISLSELTLLKELTKLIKQDIIKDNYLYNSILLFYPNINKILNHYFNEN